MEVRMEHVDFAYRQGKQILHDINLTLDEPGLICILGPNGVGKSTLIKCINKLLTPTSGDVYIDGKNVKDMRHKEIATKIGYVPVHTDDIFSMTVFETIMIGRHNKQRFRVTAEDIHKVNLIMEALDLTELADRPFNDLSAGQHQKVAIARGLVQETPMLILDEPTSNLDIKHKIYVTELLREIARRNNQIILMISHTMEVTAKYADKVILMEPPGRIRQVGTVREIYTKQNLKEVYGIDCDIVEHEGRPAILINQSQ